jgi:hypothetical protein
MTDAARWLETRLRPRVFWCACKVGHVGSGKGEEVRRHIQERCV